MWSRIVGARSAEQSVINTDGQVQKICDVFGMRDMLERFYPYEYADSVFAIDYEKLYALGYRGIIFDVDNTLVPLNADSTEEIDGLFRLTPPCRRCPSGSGRNSFRNSDG